MMMTMFGNADFCITCAVFSNWPSTHTPRTFSSTWLTASSSVSSPSGVNMRRSNVTTSPLVRSA